MLKQGFLGKLIIILILIGLITTTFYLFFGKNIIKKWQKIKDELDPNHLLNIGVIENLDTK